jgi:uncharacterized protein YtpQ (UPF0354 family)
MSLIKRLLGNRQSSTLDVQGFAQAYARAAEARFAGAKVTIEEAATAAGTKLRWTMPSGMEVNQFLGNAYAAYENSPKDLDAIIAAYLDAAPAGDEQDVATRRSNILPLVKTVMWRSASLKQLEAAGMKDNNPFLTEPLTAELLTVYVEDKPDAMSYVSAADLSSLDLRQEDLRVLALENLRRMVPEITLQGGSGRYGVRLDGNYDASMVFLAEEWRSQVEIDGDPVIAVPAREELLVCGSNDPQSIASLRNMAAQIMAQSPYGLSAQLYTWRDGTLVVFEG